MKIWLKRQFRKLLPRTVRTYRILSGQIRGASIVTSLHDYPAAVFGWTERPLLRWFADNVAAGETWLDVGAHYGYTAIALARLVGSGGRVFAFEPMISTAGCIGHARMQNGLSQLFVVPLALADCDSIELRMLPTERGMIDQTAKRLTSEPFLVTSLDSLWPSISGDCQAIHGIKIDVQGMEIYALRGMKSLLKEMRPRLVVELHRGVDREELLSLLAGFGYSREGTPVDPQVREAVPEFLDDRSYSFYAR